MKFAHAVAIGAVGADKTGQSEHAAVGKQLGDLADATDVLGAIARGKTEIPVDAQAHIVAIQAVGEHAALVQRALKGHGNGALTAARQAREPDRGAAVSEQPVPVSAGDIAAMPVHVGGFLLEHGLCALSVCVVSSGAQGKGLQVSTQIISRPRRATDSRLPPARRALCMALSVSVCIWVARRSLSSMGCRAGSQQSMPILSVT